MSALPHPPACPSCARTPPGGAQPGPGRGPQRRRAAGERALMGASAGRLRLPAHVDVHVQRGHGLQHHQWHLPEPGRRPDGALVLRQPAQLRAPAVPGERRGRHAGLGHVHGCQHEQVHRLGCGARPHPRRARCAPRGARPPPPVLPREHTSRGRTPLSPLCRAQPRPQRPARAQAPARTSTPGMQCAASLGPSVCAHDAGHPPAPHTPRPPCTTRSASRPTGQAHAPQPARPCHRVSAGRDVRPPSARRAMTPGARGRACREDAQLLQLPGQLRGQHARRHDPGHRRQLHPGRRQPPALVLRRQGVLRRGAAHAQRLRLGLLPRCAPAGYMAMG
jgi:hypothetical protein